MEHCQKVLALAPISNLCGKMARADPHQGTLQLCQLQFHVNPTVTRWVFRSPKTFQIILHALLWKCNRRWFAATHRVALRWPIQPQQVSRSYSVIEPPQMEQWWPLSRASEAPAATTVQRERCKRQLSLISSFLHRHRIFRHRQKSLKADPISSIMTFHRNMFKPTMTFPIRHQALKRQAPDSVLACVSVNRQPTLVALSAALQMISRNHFRSHHSTTCQNASIPRQCSWVSWQRQCIWRSQKLTWNQSSPAHRNRCFQSLSNQMASHSRRSWKKSNRREQAKSHRKMKSPPASSTSSHDCARWTTESTKVTRFTAKVIISW